MARKIALLIGVGHYGEGFLPLQCPANGVEAMRSILYDPNIGEFDDVVTLIDPNVSAMRSRIVGEFFAGLDKEDLVLFYFTGHGFKDTFGNFYLTTQESYLLKDGDINTGTAIEAEFIRGAIGRCYAQRKVVILDCCFGAAFAKGFLTMDDGSGSIDIEAQLGTKELGEKGCCILTAATSTQYALEQEGEPLSVYTRYLTEGLRTGGAALDGKTFISARHLHNYVKAQIKVAAPAMKPAIFNEFEGDGIAITKAYINAEQRYRKQVQAVVKRSRGKLRPSAKGNLKLSQAELRITDEQATKILAEVLKPYEEKAKHVKFYKQMLEEEKEYCYPLDEEAIEQLKNIKRRLNLRDEDVSGAERAILNLPLSAVVPVVAEESLGSTNQPSYSIFSFETVHVDMQGKATKAIPGRVSCFTEDLGGGVTLDMIDIPGGTFLMGAAKGEKGATHTEQVSWEDAVEFCKRLSQHSTRTYHLPSEALWEYACRAKTTTPFHFGPTITTKLANYGRSSKGTSKVGSFPPNGFGLHDMHGNIWEWCRDNWYDSYKEVRENIKARESSDKRKSLRGGSWGLDASICRAARRNGNPSDFRLYLIGFRIVCSRANT